MNRTFIIIVVVAALAVWGAVIFNASQEVHTVVSTERKMNINPGLKQEDCWVQLSSANGEVTGLLTKSSYCVSLNPGDKVLVVDGAIWKL